MFKKIKTRFSLVMMFGTLGLISFFPSTISAYSYSGNKWPSNAVTIDFGSPTIPSTWVTPIAQGLAAWNAASSPFTFSAGTSNQDISVSALGGGGPIAVTSLTISGGTITDADVAFNSSLTWSTSGAAGAYDVQNTATHEFGHFLRLLDLSGAGDVDKTMYFSAALGETKKRTLDVDDINGINAIYP